MAEGPIPWDVIDNYATRHGLDEDDYERFFSLIRALDAEYIRHREAQAKRKTGKE